VEAKRPPEVGKEPSEESSSASSPKEKVFFETRFPQTFCTSAAESSCHADRRGHAMCNRIADGSSESNLLAAPGVAPVFDYFQNPRVGAGFEACAEDAECEWVAAQAIFDHCPMLLVRARWHQCNKADDFAYLGNDPGASEPRNFMNEIGGVADSFCFMSDVVSDSPLGWYIDLPEKRPSCYRVDCAGAGGGAVGDRSYTVFGADWDGREYALGVCTHSFYSLYSLILLEKTKGDSKKRLIGWGRGVLKKGSTRHVEKNCTHH